MALENVQSCPICGGVQFKSFLTCQDYTTTNEVFSLSTCIRCQFVFTNPRPDQNSIGNYYKSDSYVSHTGSGKGLINSIYLFVRNYTLTWKVGILQGYKQNGSLLDYGCGTGDFLNKCQDNGFEITGIEPDADARRKAELTSGQTVGENIAAVNGKKFDLITLWHVLEHVADLKEKISQLKELLNENGIIFIAVPNHESYDATFYKEHWAAYDVPRHLWHFSKENMKSLLSEMNFSLLEIKPMKLDSFYVSLLSENYRNKEKNSISKFISGVLTGLKSNRLAKKEKNYSSLIYIARL